MSRVENIKTMVPGKRRCLRAALAGSLLCGGSLVAVVIGGALAASAQPAVSLYVVSGGAGTGDCSSLANACASIQTAITTAEAGPDNGDDVTINVAAGTYQGGNVIAASSLNSLTIAGAGASSTAANGGGGIRDFSIGVGTVTISGLTITGGLANGDFGGGIKNFGNLTLSNVQLTGNRAYVGGGIFNAGPLTVSNSQVAGNSANYGAGIDNQGTVDVTDSTISGNSAGRGGGIDNGQGNINGSSGIVTVTDSTLANNTATDGGGIDNGDDGGSGTLTVTASTFVGNSATNDGASIDNADNSGGGTASLGATILAGATSGNECSGTITDEGYNLDDDGTCGLSSAAPFYDLPSTNPLLGPLQNNGGPTDTTALMAGSPAIDYVTSASGLCLATDQRGAPRTAPCDIGAYDTDWGPAITLNVSGVQYAGGSPSFSYTTNAPGGTVSGTLTCTTANGGTPLSSLPPGTDTVDGSSCTGLTSSDQADYPIFPSSYAGITNGFSVVSAAGTWGPATEVPGAAGGSGYFNNVSCTDATDCTAVGQDHDGHPIYVTDTAGTWGAPTEVPGGGFFNDVSCTDATDCTAVGGNGQPFYATEAAGVWGPATDVPVDGGGGSFFGVSCSDASDCTAVGQDHDDQPIYATETAGTWAAVAIEIPAAGGGGVFNDVICSDVSDCTAVGQDYDEQPIYATETSGTWGGTTEAPGGGGGVFYGVSCADASDCTAIGSDGGQPIYATETAGTWATPVGISGAAGGGGYLFSVSCADAADCTAVGQDNNNEPIYVSEAAGSWGPAVEISGVGGGGFFDGVSCTDAAACTAVGQDDNHQPIYATSVTLPLPVVSVVSPDTGYTNGLNKVTITGSGFTGATAVDFGPGTPGTIDTESGDSLSVTVPTASAGTVDVTVSGPGGTSSVTPADEYTYTVDQTVPSAQTCSNSVCPANSVSTPLNQTVVTLPSQAGPSGAVTDLLVNTATLSCGTAKAHDYDYPTAVATLSSTGFAPKAALTVTETVANTPSAAGVKVCYGAGSNPARGTFLRPCNHAMKAPCLESLHEAGGSVTATIKARATDPRFWTGEAAVDLTSFSPPKGAPNATVTIKGKNLTGVLAVVIGGAEATISPQSTATKLVVTVPAKAVTGLITVTSAAGKAVSTKSFTVT